MRSFLIQPYPFNDDAARRLVVCACIGLFVALFLAIFQPFGFDNLPFAARWTHAVLFGLVTFVVSAFFQVIFPKLFPQLFKEESWRSWKEIVFLLLTTCAIGGANYGLMTLLYEPNDAATGFWGAQLMTLQVGVFPVVAVVFMKQLTLYRRFAAEAVAVTENMHEESETAPLPASRPVIALKGEGQKEELSLPAGDLLFIASADNYVSVHFREGAQMKSVLLRITLKKAEEQLAAQETFFRCHRMYLVNLHNVEAVSGNAQGLKLHIAGTETSIPVSRGLTEGVRSRLHHLSRSPQTA